MRVVAAFALVTSLAVVPCAFAADVRAEDNAQDVLKKVANDYLAMDYGRAAAQIDQALRACRASRCASGTLAALSRDLGTMQFRMGDSDNALKSFDAALSLKGDLELNPDYDAPDLRALWKTRAHGRASAAAGDFDHTPPSQQRTGTPLPIYVVLGGEAVARVLVKYQVEGASDWKSVDLERTGAGWGGLIPCGDVRAGALRYFVQGLTADHETAAAGGDAKRPYVVSIRDDAPGNALHLPGASPPAPCRPARAEAVARAGSEPRGGSAKPSDDDEPALAKPSEEPSRTTGPRVWLGGAVTIDFMTPPSGNNLCRLDPNTARPANSANIYCVGADGSDFPARNDGGAQNGALVPGQGGHSSGNVAAGGLRLMVALDVAVSTNWLVGLRIGGVSGEYPGQLAVRDGVAPGVSYHVEGRVSWVIGDSPLQRAGVAPLLFAGGGVSEFDEHASSTVSVNAYRDATGRHAARSQAVDLWLTNGPGFVVVGAGLRYAPFRRLALTGVVRASESFGKNGLVPAVGPELTVQYGLW